MTLLALAFGRKKSHGQWDMLIILLTLGIADVAGQLAAILEG